MHVDGTEGDEGGSIEFLQGLVDFDDQVGQLSLLFLPLALQKQSLLDEALPFFYFFHVHQCDVPLDHLPRRCKFTEVGLTSARAVLHATFKLRPCIHEYIN
jgi:hypothetical protein